MTDFPEPVLDDATVAAYLRRIGAARPARPTAAALRELHERHVMTVPFETVDVHLRRPHATGLRAIDKIVHRRRGGICYELNGAFAALLRALGYEVTMLAGRVSDGGVLGPVFGHMLLLVTTADSPGQWLADVGYGRGARHPLRFGSRGPQQDPQGVFRLAEAPYGDLDLFRDDVLQYRFETRPRAAEDFHPMCWWHYNAPDSPHVTHLYCTLPTPGGRVTLSGDTLTLRENGRRVRTVLDGEEELRQAYRAWFGIELDELPPLPVSPARAEETNQEMSV
ncbi:arylamine N-acetyltransferase family protein [Microbispora siamensis]|uniref:N-hydroxyarylamine O-acetyltransferase n=1 Tax=Microbispora siamensis TaxID=564413 RepID=A0ABQ4GZL5_9ACTN|nr:arylamine N-acetyltransferase [Microbispora siamensis]GIH66878.1 N-hydroxyarylamine O-acetyltransferase [Microbispora siamensis]